MFQNNGDPSKTLSLESATYSASANVNVQPDNGYVRQYWTLERVYNPPCGARLYDKITGSAATDVKKHISIGETYLLSSLDLFAAAYAPSDVSQTMYWYSFDDGIAAVNSSTGAVTGKARGTTTIVGRKELYGDCYYISYQVRVGLPEVMYQLINRNLLNGAEVVCSSDSLYITTKSLGDILWDVGIDRLYNSEGDNKGTPVQGFYDDWYLLAVPRQNDYVYGLYKMREQEHDDYGSNDPGVTIPFVAFDTNNLFQCLNDPTKSNRIALLQNCDRVTGPGRIAHDTAIAAYFADPASDGAYLIAEEYVKFIARTGVDGKISVPEQYAQILDKIDQITELLPTIHDAEAYLQLHEMLVALRRVPNAVDDNNAKAGYIVYNEYTRKITVRNPDNLTMYEKYVILATHTGNVTFNSFAAEVQFHADALDDFLANFPQYYEAALRADMAIGEEYESGFFDGYYDLDGDLVKKQIQYHGKY